MKEKEKDRKEKGRPWKNLFVLTLQKSSFNLNSQFNLQIL